MDPHIWPGKSRTTSSNIHAYSSYVRIRNAALKTCLRRWTIGRSGVRGSRISMPMARHHDDDDDVLSILSRMTSLFNLIVLFLFLSFFLAFFVFFDYLICFFLFFKRIPRFFLSFYVLFIFLIFFLLFFSLFPLSFSSLFPYLFIHLFIYLSYLFN